MCRHADAQQERLHRVRHNKGFEITFQVQNVKEQICRIFQSFQFPSSKNRTKPLENNAKLAFVWMVFMLQDSVQEKLELEKL